MGYSDTLVPPVIQRNVLENPGWYTQYTPYQAEISQGRLEALLNFQTMVADLTALPLANASLLDEATAAAEAMALCFGVARHQRRGFFVAQDCHPQTIGVVRTRASRSASRCTSARSRPPIPRRCSCAARCSSTRPATGACSIRARSSSACSAAARSPSSPPICSRSTLITPPGELGADVAVGSTQRFGVPLGGGGPHAAYFATRDVHARRLPAGSSACRATCTATRLSARDPDARAAHPPRQGDEQHLHRAGAAREHRGLVRGLPRPGRAARIARRVRGLTCVLAEGLRRMGHELGDSAFFDTIRVVPSGVRAKEVIAAAAERGFNLRDFGDDSVGVSFDETTTRADVERILAAFAGGESPPAFGDLVAAAATPLPRALERTGEILVHPVFRAHHGEHEMLRYLHRLESRDLSLTTSMIPLGSCTMKLNADERDAAGDLARARAAAPVRARRSGRGHRRDGVGARDLARGDHRAAGGLAAAERGLAGRVRGPARDPPLPRGARRSAPRRVPDPVSAHGTNPASAVIAGFRVVAVRCDDAGNVDLADLRARCAEHARELGALMITYPSTHGVFEAAVREICAIVHEHGGPGVHGRREHERAGRPHLARADRRRRVPPEPAQDVLHPARRRRTRHGTDRRAKHLEPFLPGDPAHGEGRGVGRRRGGARASCRSAGSTSR
jgi:glycine dehydrogenase